MDVIELKKIANEVRKGIVTSVHSAKAGHPGGSLSAADVFTYLYFEEMNIDPADPKNTKFLHFVTPKDNIKSIIPGAPIRFNSIYEKERSSL